MKTQTNPTNAPSQEAFRISVASVIILRRTETVSRSCPACGLSLAALDGDGQPPLITQTMAITEQQGATLATEETSETDPLTYAHLTCAAEEAAATVLLSLRCRACHHQIVPLRLTTSEPQPSSASSKLSTAAAGGSSRHSPTDSVSSVPSSDQTNGKSKRLAFDLAPES